MFFCYLIAMDIFTSVFNDIKLLISHKTKEIKVFSLFFSLLVEGYGSGSEQILRIRIRKAPKSYDNTAIKLAGSTNYLQPLPPPKLSISLSVSTLWSFLVSLDTGQPPLSPPPPIPSLEDAMRLPLNFTWAVHNVYFLRLPYI
jgi:hypothetical protein